MHLKQHFFSKTAFSLKIIRITFQYLKFLIHFAIEIFEIMNGMIQMIKESEEEISQEIGGYESYDSESSRVEVVASTTPTGPEVAVESRISTAISSANDPLDDDIRRAI
jgi:hypothetical protein